GSRARDRDRGGNRNRNANPGSRASRDAGAGRLAATPVYPTSSPELALRTCPGLRHAGSMYTPPHNRQEDPDEILAFMREYAFATLVTAGAGGMVATHIPLSVRRDGDSLRISGHIARANQQAAHLAAGTEAMAIFT